MPGFLLLPNRAFKASIRGSIASSSWLHKVWFKFSPQTGHKPLQSALHNGLMGVANNISSRIRGARLIFPFSGRINPDSVTEFRLKAYNSVNSVSRGWRISSRQRTHSVRTWAVNFPCSSNPWAVLVTLTTPERSNSFKSGESLTSGASNGNSRLYPIV